MVTAAKVPRGWLSPGLPAFGESPNRTWGQLGNTGKTWRGLLQAPVLSRTESQKHTRRDLAEHGKGLFTPPFLCTPWREGRCLTWAGRTGQAGGGGVKGTGRRLWGLSAHIRWLHKLGNWNYFLHRAEVCSQEYQSDFEALAST